MSPELAAEDLEDLLAYPAALRERREGEVVRVHLAQACNINMNCQEKSSILVLIYKDYHIYPFPKPVSLPLFAGQSVLCRIEHFCEVRVRSRSRSGGRGRLRLIRNQNTEKHLGDPLDGMADKPHHRLRDFQLKVTTKMP